MDSDANIRRRMVHLDVAPAPKETPQLALAGSGINASAAIHPDDAPEPADGTSETAGSNRPETPSGDQSEAPGAQNDGGDNTDQADGDSPSDKPPANNGDQRPAWYKRWFGGLAARMKTHPRITIASAFVLLLLISGLSAYGLAVSHRKKPAPTKPVVAKKVTPPAPVPIVSPLTGIPVSADQAKHIVTGVMIENTTFARPQSGLKDAGVVFEAIAEAGITRFLALFQETTPTNVGPIRSARPYYVDWAHSFDAPLAHVGGSPDALSKIKTDGIKDLDQFYNSGSYHRVSSRDAPHNVYTGIPTLNDLENSKGWTSSNFSGFLRKKEAPAKDPTTKSIDIAISGPTYNVHYDYDAASNSYLRFEGGEAHKDAETGAQLSPKVVIGLVAPYSLMSDGYHSQYQTTGSGVVYVFQDGAATKGTWTKKDATSQYVFTDENGHPLALDPGQTWITVVGDASDIVGKP